MSIQLIHLFLLQLLQGLLECAVFVVVSICVFFLSLVSACSSSPFVKLASV